MNLRAIFGLVWCYFYNNNRNTICHFVFTFKSVSFCVYVWTKSTSNENHFFLLIYLLNALKWVSTHPFWNRNRNGNGKKVWIYHIKGKIFFLFPAGKSRLRSSKFSCGQQENNWENVMHGVSEANGVRNFWHLWHLSAKILYTVEP